MDGNRCVAWAHAMRGATGGRLGGGPAPPWARRMGAGLVSHVGPLGPLGRSLWVEVHLGGAARQLSQDAAGRREGRWVQGWVRWVLAVGLGASGLPAHPNTHQSLASHHPCNDPLKLTAPGTAPGRRRSQAGRTADRCWRAPPVPTPHS